MKKILRTNLVMYPSNFTVGWIWVGQKEPRCLRGAPDAGFNVHLRGRGGGGGEDSEEGEKTTCLQEEAAQGPAPSQGRKGGQKERYFPFFCSRHFIFAPPRRFFQLKFSRHRM